MDSRENSKLLQQSFVEEEQYTCYPSVSVFPSNPYSCFSNLFSMSSMVMECNELKNARANSFMPSEATSRDSDAVNSEADESDNDVNLDELLHDAKAKKKIELLAAMVGVDSKEPAIVLTEVVRVLKYLENKSILGA